MTLSNLGVLAAQTGDLERGRSLLGDALALFEETDDAPGQAGMRLNLGNLAADAGERERTRELLEASRRVGGTAADRDTERAANLLDAALGVLRGLGDRWGWRGG